MEIAVSFPPMSRSVLGCASRYIALILLLRVFSAFLSPFPVKVVWPLLHWFSSEYIPSSSWSVTSTMQAEIRAGNELGGFESSTPYQSLFNVLLFSLLILRACCGGYLLLNLPGQSRCLLVDGWFVCWQTVRCSPLMSQLSRGMFSLVWGSSFFLPHARLLKSFKGSPSARLLGCETADCRLLPGIYWL